MHGDIREDVARFYTELTHRLLGGTINHDHINVPCDLRLTKMGMGGSEGSRNAGTSIRFHEPAGKAS